MSYVKHNFTSGSKLYASQLNQMDTQIEANESGVTNIKSKLQITGTGTEYTQKLVAPTKHVPKELYHYVDKKSYVKSSEYAYAFYSVTAGDTYYVTCSAHNNSSDYPAGCFYDSSDAIISYIGTSPAQVLTNYEVAAPTGAVKLVLNKTVSAQKITCYHKVQVTGSTIIDGISDKIDETDAKLTNFINEYETANSVICGSIIEPTSSVVGSIYDVITESTYGNSSSYGHAFYSINGGVKIFVQCQAASNANNYPGGAFYDQFGNMISTFCDAAQQKFEEVLVSVPANATKFVLNKNGGITSCYAKTAISAAGSSSTAHAYNLNIADALIAENKKNKFCMKTLDKGYISFVFDDLKNNIDSVAAVFEEYDMPLCIAAIPDRLNVKATGLNAASQSFTVGMSMSEVMAQVVTNGGEILSHNTEVVTATNQYDYDFMYDYFVNSKSSLENAGFTIKGLIRAGGTGAINNSTEIDRWLIGNYSYSNMGTLPQYSFERISINQPIADIKTAIDNCATNKTWIRFMCHDYNYDGGQTFYSETILREILTYIGTKDAEVVTYEDMIDEFGTDELASTKGLYLEIGDTTAHTKIINAIDQGICDIYCKYHPDQTITQFFKLMSITKLNNTIVAKFSIVEVTGNDIYIRYTSATNSANESITVWDSVSYKKITVS